MIRETYYNYGHKYTDHMNLKELHIKEDRYIKRKRKKQNVIKNRLVKRRMNCRVKDGKRENSKKKKRMILHEK